jgi:hypothetical protein
MSIVPNPSECIQCHSTTHLARCGDCGHSFCNNDACLVRQEKDDIRPLKPHRMCAECGKTPVCFYKGICRACDLPCHAITDRVSVGSCAASYKGFDLIFDLNYPENGQAHGTIGRRDTATQTIWKIGIHDRNTTEDLDLLRQTILLLRFHLYKQQETGNAPPRVLFHCFAGYSRSVALATAYLALSQRLSVDDAFALVKAGRKYVGPQEAFMALLRKEITV